MADFKIELVAWWSKDGDHGVMDAGTGEDGDHDDDDDVWHVCYQSCSVNSCPAMLDMYICVCSTPIQG